MIRGFRTVTASTRARIRWTSWRMARHSPCVCATIALVGCTTASDGNIGRAPRAAVESNTVTSEVLSGTREKGPYASDWTVHIEVQVEAWGPAFGFRQFTYLSLDGPMLVEDRRTWLNFNSDGWPESYVVMARYDSWTELDGEVTVEVMVDDTGHSAYRDIVYRARHPIQWEEATKP